MLRRRKREPDPTTTFHRLRTMVLTEAAGAVSPLSDAHPDVLGVVIDIPRGDEVAALVALADGTTSLYTSSGGGTLGGGGHPPVVAAGTALLTALQGDLELFPPDDRVDLPAPDMVQLTILTPSGRRRASIPSAAFWGQEPSTVIHLVSAAQAVLSALREATPPS